MVAEHQPLLEIRDINLRFGGTIALEDVSFRLNTGDIRGLIGPNGAGKSSLLNVVSGVYRPTSGKVFLDGEEVTGFRPPAMARAGIARTFQNIVMFPGLTVVENLLVGRYIHRRSNALSGALRLPRARRDEAQHLQRVMDLVEALGLQSYLQRRVDSLPYGVLKQLEVGRALAMEPRLLLLDEPMAGMNQDEKEEMGELILRVQRDLCPSILLIEHDMRMMMALSTRIVVLDFGRKIADGTPAEVQSDEAVLEAYLGTNPAATGLGVDALLGSAGSI